MFWSCFAEKLYWIFVIFMQNVYAIPQTDLNDNKEMDKQSSQILFLTFAMKFGVLDLSFDIPIIAMVSLSF